MGTFDPPHLGHQALLELAYGQLRLKQIYLLPNYRPGHKPEATPFALRYNMVSAWQKDLPFIALPPARTLQNIWQADAQDPMGSLLHWIASQHAENTRYFQLMGTDSFNKLVAYQKLPKAGDSRHVVVIDRPGYQTVSTTQTEQLT
ncbi:MAG: hypothetical protein IGS03_03830 [Candidatus Sericytochromatia bacterium]|nr:hypothetical protein [Candidatus Sericytochromatia bacterium]